MQCLPTHSLDRTGDYSRSGRVSGFRPSGRDGCLLQSDQRHHRAAERFREVRPRGHHAGEVRIGRSGLRRWLRANYGQTRCGTRLIALNSRCFENGRAGLSIRWLRVRVPSSSLDESNTAEAICAFLLPIRSAARNLKSCGSLPQNGVSPHTAPQFHSVLSAPQTVRTGDRHSRRSASKGRKMPSWVHTDHPSRRAQFVVPGFLIDQMFRAENGQTDGL